MITTECLTGRERFPIKNLAPRNIEIFKIFATGLSGKQTMHKVNLRSNPSNYRETIYDYFDVDNMIAAVICGIKQGFLNFEELTKDLDENLITKLTKQEKNIIDVIKKSNGKIKCCKDIASSLPRTSKKKENNKKAPLNAKTIKNHLTNMYKKTGLNQLQLVLTCMKYERENERRKKEIYEGLNCSSDLSQNSNTTNHVVFEGKSYKLIGTLNDFREVPNPTAFSCIPPTNIYIDKKNYRILP